MKTFGKILLGFFVFVIVVGSMFSGTPMRANEQQRYNEARQEQDRQEYERIFKEAVYQDSLRR